MTRKEKEAYECYMDRLSSPMHPILLSEEECKEYNKKHPLPGQETIDNILREAGAL